MLDKLNVERLTLEQLVSCLGYLKGGFNSSWNDKMKKKVLAAAKYLISKAKQMTTALGIEFTTVTNSTTTIPMEKFIGFVRRTGNWTNDFARVTGNSKYNTEEINDYEYRTSTKRKYYEQILDNDSLCESCIIIKNKKRL